MDTKNEFSPKIIKSAVKLYGLARYEGVDVIHAHTRVSQVAAAVVSRFTGVPYVTTCHGFFKKRLRGIFDTWGSKVIAISDAVKAHLARDFRLQDDRIELIYSGVDIGKYLKEYSEEDMDKVRISVGLMKGPVVGTIGRLSPIKGQKYFIRAMKDVIAREKGIQMLMVGDGPERGRLKDLTLSLGMDSSVRFKSAVFNTQDYLAVMDIFVFPSLREGLGMALLEALAAGKPCIASDVGGISNIIKGGYNGILVPPGDIPAISEAVTNLLNNKDLAARMGDRGRTLVKERFSHEVMALKVMGLYEKVIGK
jgi:glycosyltransferase involved in cell wall biosynthesis